MDSDQEKLNILLKRLGDPGAAPLSAEETAWLEDFRSRYPFFTIPELSSGDSPQLREVVTAPSGEALARMRGEAGASRFDDFYPPHKPQPTPSTSAAIDDFLNTYGHQSKEEDELLERLIFNPIPDYAQQLARQEEADLPSLPSSPEDANATRPDGEAVSNEDRLNRFILSHRQPLPPSASAPTPVSPSASVSAPAPASTTQAGPIGGGSLLPSEAKASSRRPSSSPTAAPASDGLLSESLAKIYIKTHRYEQAYEILNGLSLRFPEKSSYFADQLRFLRKLILNERRKRDENQDKNNPNSNP